MGRTLASAGPKKNFLVNILTNLSHDDQMPCMSINENLGNNLKYLRLKHGLSQAALAKISQVPRSTIANVEVGDANPTLTVLASLARSLSVPIEELIATPRLDVNVYKKGQLAIKTSGGVTISELLPEPMPGICFERMSFVPQSHKRGVPHTLGTKEYLYVENGDLTVYVAGLQEELSLGDVMVFRGDQPHSYHNYKDVPAIALSVVMFST